LKAEKTNINIVKDEELKNKIRKLAAEEDCDKLKAEVRGLAERLDVYAIKKTDRKDYVEFYEVLGYKGKNRIYGFKIGKISRERYEKNKEIIEQLRKEANSEELRKLLKKIMKEE